MKTKSTKHNVKDGSIGYKGEVNVKLKDSTGLILYENTFHNKGYKTLFRFLCECLAGDYPDAEKFRPLKIRVFNCAEPPQVVKTNFEKGDFDSPLISALSGAIITDTRAQVIENTNDNSFSAIFHFTIPFAYLNSLTKDINLMMLYPSTAGSLADSEVEAESNKKGLLAYYLFTDKKDSTKWDPIKLAEFESKENTNLIIEWKMSILNID